MEIILKKREISFILSNIWNLIDMDKPENHQQIVDYIFNDICLTADPENWSNGDVVIGLRRWMEEQSFNK